MRALWLAIVACIIALGGAVGGVGGVGAGELEGSLASGAPAVAQSSARVRAQAGSPELHAVTSRPSRARANDLPLAALSAAPEFAASQRRVLVLFPLGDGRLAALPALTGSARGPPIA
jgi:hypothetical protein